MVKHPILTGIIIGFILGLIAGAFIPSEGSPNTSLAGRAFTTSYSDDPIGYDISLTTFFMFLTTFTFLGAALGAIYSISTREKPQFPQ